MSTDPKTMTADEYNERVQAWNQRLRSLATQSLMLLTNEEKQQAMKKRYRKAVKTARSTGAASTMEQPLIASLKAREFQRYGEIYGISQSFSRHGVFVHYGVSKGHPAKGSSMVMTGSGKSRKPFDWINKHVHDTLPELEQIVMEYYGDKSIISIASILNLKDAPTL